MASVVNRKGTYSRTAGSAVPDNARAARCTGIGAARSARDSSRTASSAVPVNAPAARSTMDDDSRTRSLRVYDTETTSMLKTI